MPVSNIPDRDDVVELDFDPHKGHEQGGKRPALVLSPVSYNRSTGLFVVCPITSKVKGFVFEVRIPTGLGVEGVVLSDQIKNLAWKERGTVYRCDMPLEVVADVLAKANTLINPQ